MSGSAYISYQVDAGESSFPGVLIKSEEPPANKKRKPAAKHTSTSFVLVDPSDDKSKGGGKDARSSIRKHASKACAAQRLATVAEKKKSSNQLTKRERKAKQAAEKLEAALEEHAKRFNVVKVESVDVQTGSHIRHASDGHFSYDRRISDSSETLSDDTPGSWYESTRKDSVRKKCSIPWLLDPTPLCGNSEDDRATQSERTIKQGLVRWQPHPVTAYIPSTLRDQLRYTNFDYVADERVEYLVHFMLNSIFDLMILRLPTKADRQLGKTNIFKATMPHLMLNSEPLFWALVLCAGTLDSLRTHQIPGDDDGNRQYRDLAISCINKRLNAQEDELVLDCGLVSAVASLGLWERQCGSREIWRAHCKGAQTLLQKLRASNSDRMVAQIIASCEDEVPELGNEVRSPGFKRITKLVDLDPELVSSVCACEHLALMQPYEYRLDLLESTAADILRHTTLGTMSKVIRFPNRINLEMHVLVQGAGVSMINFMAGKTIITNVDQIDFSEMCRESVDLAKSVGSNPVYDELLLWALLTIHALNNSPDPTALSIISQIAQRLHIDEWPLLEGLLRSFVYLESATVLYRALCSMVLPQAG